MSAHRDTDLDRVLGAYLGEGPVEAPDRAIEAALDRAAKLRQRRRPLIAWRFAAMNARLVLAAALLLTLLAVGAVYLGSRPPDQGPVPAPTPSPAGSASPRATTGASPEASVAASASQPAAQASPVVRLSLRALILLDASITAAQQPGSLTSDQQSRLLRLTDAIRFPLEEGGNLGEAQTALPALEAAVDAASGALTGPRGDRVRTALAGLGAALSASPFEPAALQPGTHYPTTFTPLFAVTIPDGWERGIEDAEVLVMRKGGLTLAFNKIGTEVSEVGLAKALGTADPTALAVPPVAVTLGRFPGFVGESSEGGTLWFTEGLQAYDAAPGARVRAWLIGLGSSPLTIDLDGPPAEVAGALPEIEAMLATLQAP